MQGKLIVTVVDTLPHRIRSHQGDGVRVRFRLANGRYLCMYFCLAGSSEAKSKGFSLLVRRVGEIIYWFRCPPARHRAWGMSDRINNTFCMYRVHGGSGVRGKRTKLQSLCAVVIQHNFQFRTRPVRPLPCADKNVSLAKTWRALVDTFIISELYNTHARVHHNGRVTTEHTVALSGEFGCAGTGNYQLQVSR